MLLRLCGTCIPCKVYQRRSFYSAETIRALTIHIIMLLNFQAEIHEYSFEPLTRLFFELTHCKALSHNLKQKKKNSYMRRVLCTMALVVNKTHDHRLHLSLNDNNPSTFYLPNTPPSSSVVNSPPISGTPFNNILLCIPSVLVFPPPASHKCSR